MGDPRKIRRKYSFPSHPWQKARIEEENELLKKYGLKNKTEIWKMYSFLTDIYKNVKRLVPLTSPQAMREKKQLQQKVIDLGLLAPSATFSDILMIKLEDVMSRRLQSVVAAKNLAHSMRQARQMVVHEHITVGGRTITMPSYLVGIQEQEQIHFSSTSPFADTNHAERARTQKVEVAASKKMEHAKPQAAQKENAAPKQTTEAQGKATEASS